MIGGPSNVDARSREACRATTLRTLPTHHPRRRMPGTTLRAAPYAPLLPRPGISWRPARDSYQPSWSQDLVSATVLPHTLPHGGSTTDGWAGVAAPRALRPAAPEVARQDGPKPTTTRNTVARPAGPSPSQKKPLTARRPCVDPLPAPALQQTHHVPIFGRHHQSRRRDPATCCRASTAPT